MNAEFMKINNGFGYHFINSFIDWRFESEYNCEDFGLNKNNEE